MSRSFWIQLLALCMACMIGESARLLGPVAKAYAGGRAVHPVGAIWGAVENCEGDRIPYPHVEIVNEQAVNSLSEEGEFLLAGVGVGMVPLLVKPVGYEPRLIPVRVKAGETTLVYVAVVEPPPTHADSFPQVRASQ